MVAGAVTVTRTAVQAVNQATVLKVEKQLTVHVVQPIITCFAEDGLQEDVAARKASVEVHPLIVERVASPVAPQLSEAPPLSSAVQRQVPRQPR